MEKIKITNAGQFEKLVEELERNPALARGFRRGSVPNDFKEQWECIATALNSLGPPIRTGDGWQKVWRDLKFKVRRKMIANKMECETTTGGIFKEAILSSLEKAVANLLQFQKQFNPEGMVQGVTNTECELHPQMDSDNLNSLLTSFETKTEAATTSKAAKQIIATTTSKSTSLSIAPSTSKAFAPSTTRSSNFSKRKHNNSQKYPNDRHSLLEAHSRKQAKILTEISNSMASMKRIVIDVKEIEETRLKIETERNEREREMHLIDIEIKKIDLSIKKKELQLLQEDSEIDF